MRKLYVERGTEKAIAAAAIAIVKYRPVRQRVKVDWTRHPYQVRPEGEWMIWVLEGGRGSGKTRTGAEEVLYHIEHEHGGRQCFPAGTSMGGRFVGGLKAWYRGKIVELTTASGRRLSVTPNHPILTTEGFRAADMLREGDRVIGERVGVPVLSSVDHDYRPAPIEQIFQTFAEAEDAASDTRAATRSDLHGDGHAVQGDIQVVTAGGLLRSHGDTTRTQRLEQLRLESPHGETGLLTIERPARELFVTHHPSAASLPRSAEKCFGVGRAPAVAQRVGVIAEADVVLPKVIGERRAVDMAFLGELEDRFPGLVAPDEIVNVRYHEFAGHVYDLEAEGGWQSANGIIASNCHVGVGAPTNDDVRKVCFEEESGLMGVQVDAADRFRKYNRQALEAWHESGALISGVGSEEPGRWNGRNFCFIWWDEGSLCNPESLTQSLLALRKKYMSDGGIEQQPRMLITTTPKPSKHIREWKTQPTTVVTRGTTYDNLDNLSQATVMELKRRYEGTTLGRRELMGEDIDDVEGALWKRSWIDDNRVKEAPGLARVVVAIDPAVTHGADSDETGIAVTALGDDGEFYVLHLQGYRLSPDGWAKRALDLYDQFAADKLIAERNNGGEMVEATIRQAAKDQNRVVPVKTIVASRGKTVRAEPVAALYEQGRVHHVGIFRDGEEQMCAFPIENEHDDLVDAAVYGVSELAGPQREWRAA